MKKKIMLGVCFIIVGILFFALGYYTTKIKETTTFCAPSKEENSPKLIKGLTITEMQKVNNNFIISGYSNEENEDYMYIYNEDGQLQKNLKKATFMENILLGDKIVYNVYHELGRGGAHSTTYILNENLDIILETKDLPEQFEGMDEAYFTAYYNQNGTFSILINDIYIYDNEGKLIKTIDNKNEQIKGATSDYYVLKENGKLNLVKYEDDSKYLVINNNQANLMYSPISGSAPLIRWNSEKELVIDIMIGDDYETATCNTITYKEKNGKLTEIKKENRECY